MPEMSILEEFEPTALPLWREALVGFDWLSLRASPVYRCIDVPPGDGSGVVVVPGFLGSDSYLGDLRGWLKRLGYRPYMSGIGRNIDCQNVLLDRLMDTVDIARAETNGKVHLIGHSLGGVLARSAATLKPRRIASVITMSSPFRGVRAHPLVIQAATFVRRRIHGRQESSDLPKECYSGYCQCDAVDALRRPFPASVRQTAIFTKTDGVVDWRFCITESPQNDFEVPGTHAGLAFNPQVYGQIADRLAAAQKPSAKPKAKKKRGIRTYG